MPNQERQLWVITPVFTHDVITSPVGAQDAIENPLLFGMGIPVTMM